MAEKKRLLDGLLNHGECSSEDAFRMAMEDMKMIDVEKEIAAMCDRNPFEEIYDLGVKPCHISGSPDFIEKYYAYYCARKDSENATE